MRDGPAAGLEIVNDIVARGELEDYPLTHSVRADFYRRLGKRAEARAAYQEAITRTKMAPERRFLEKRLEELA
jgi:RNA polymerase sigma-70 factor, ECF subfamily